MHPTTDEIVREALAEDEKAWKSKKKLAAKARSDDDDISDDADEESALKKRGRDEGPEEEEGAPVTAKRAKDIKKTRAERRFEEAAGITHIDEGAEAEEDMGDEAREHEREEGIKITPFKLEGDEEEGTYNEDGVFVLGNGRKGRDGEEDDEEEDGDADEGERGDDEWFRSEGGQELEEQARINHEAQLKAMREANAARKAMGVAEEASIKKRMIGYLEAGETVAAALRRIGALVEEQRRSRRGKGGKEVAEEDEVARKKREFEEKAQRMQFDTLTDLADQLLESGDMDVYGMTREDLERATSLLAPAAGAPGPSGAAGAAADDDMDIFGDDAEDTKDAEVKGAAEAGGNEAHAEPGMAAQGAAQPATGAAGVVPGGVGTGGAQVQTAKDFEHWPVKELKRFLEERGDDVGKYTEKDQLVARVVEVANEGPQGPGGQVGVTPPPGYVLEPTSGYYWSASNGLYFDSKTGMFFNPQLQKWQWA